MSIANPLRGLSPFGPIFDKELRVTARRKRSYLLRVCYLGALLLVMSAVYASMADESMGGGSVARSQRAAMLGMAFFACFSIFSIWTMGIIGPVLTATAIGAERLHKTFDVLLMTPMSAWQIVAGKLFSRVLVALTLMGLSLPVLALVRLLGGVELNDMIAIVCVATSVALSSAAIGLFFSTFINRAYAVILLSYAVQGVLYLFVPFMIITWTVAGRAGPRLAMLDLLAVINPYFLPMFMLNGALGMRGGPLGQPWIWCALVQVTFAALLLLASAWIVRRAARRGGGERPRAVVPQPVAIAIQATANENLAVHSQELSGGNGHEAAAPVVARIASPAAEATSHLPASSSGATVSDHPILWRELRRTLMPRRVHRIIGAILCVGLLLLSYLLFYQDNALRYPGTQIGYAIIANAIAWVMCAVIAATAIAQEKESDTWTLLLVTPISGRAIVWGKTLGVTRRFLWPFLLLLAHFLIFAIAGVIRFESILLIAWVILTFNCIWVATGVYLSLRFRKVTTAVIINLLLAVMIYAGVAVVLQIIGGLLLTHSRLRYELGANIGWYLPYFYLGQGMDGLNASRTAIPNYSGPTSGTAMTGFEFFSLVVMVGLAYVVAALVILWLAAVRLDRIVGRARQRQPLAPSTNPTRRLLPAT